MPFSISTPTMQDKQELDWRGITREDIPDIWNLFQVVNRVDSNDNNQTIQDMEREFDDPWSNGWRDGRVIRTLKGKLAAFARIFVSPQPANENVAYLWCEVAPEARDEGLEQECLDWMEERATERLEESAQAEGAGGLPRVLRTSLPETAREAIRLYEENGFRHTRSFFKMERNLRDPFPTLYLPEGLTLRTYDTDIDEPLRQAFNEAFDDHWGNQPVPPEEWHPFVMDASGIRRDLTLVLMQGEQVVAFCINRVHPPIHPDPRTLGWIRAVGTRRKWRKQGIASALVVESMRRFYAEGFDRVGLGVDTENLTGALALYERLGFKPFKTSVILETRVDS